MKPDKVGWTYDAPFHPDYSFIDDLTLLADPTGRGRLLERPQMPVEIKGVTYPSHTAAAISLGRSQSTISKAVKEGRENDMTPKKNYEVEKLEFSRMSDAGKFLKVPVRCVKKVTTLV